MKKIAIAIFLIGLFITDLSAQDINQIREIVDPQDRNLAIFKWINENPSKLYESDSKNSKQLKNCNELGVELFQLIINSCIPKDCWNALLLFKKIFPESERYPSFDKPCFGSKEGRYLLLEIALDDNKSLEERKTALCGLDDENTYWPVIEDNSPSHIQGLDKNEQSEIIGSLILLLNSDIPVIRQYAVDAILRASCAERGAPVELDTKEALPILATLYKVEHEGIVMNSLAESIIAIGGYEFWEDLSGNPLGVVVMLKEDSWLEKRDDGVCLNLYFHYGPCGWFKGSKMILEKLDNNINIIERNLWDYNFEVGHGSTENSIGFLGSSCSCFISYSVLSPGNWRISVSGTVETDDGFYNWNSVPYTIIVPEGDIKECKDSSMESSSLKDQNQIKTAIEKYYSENPSLSDFKPIKDQIELTETNKEETIHFYTVLAGIFATVILLVVVRRVLKHRKNAIL